MHLVALCDRYPSFTFNVHALRPLYDKKGAKKDSTLIRFSNRVLDTKAAGLTEEEAEHVKAALERMKDYPPLFGRDIQLLVVETPEPLPYEQPPTAHRRIRHEK